MKCLESIWIQGLLALGSHKKIKKCKAVTYDEKRDLEIL